MRSATLALSCVVIAACGGAVSGGGATPDAGSADAAVDHASAGDDAAHADASPGSDAAPPGDGGGSPFDAGDFFSALAGIWLVGWSGGLNHYSWVRFDGSAAGTADYDPGGAEILSNAPYWSCSGQGSYTVTQKPNTVLLTFPAACNLPALVLTFDSFYSQGIPPKATLGAHVSTDPPNQPLDGFKFPPSQCDANMTTCQAPF
jgi:hypothetical protein